MSSGRKAARAPTKGINWKKARNNFIIGWISGSCLALSLVLLLAILSITLKQG